MGVIIKPALVVLVDFSYELSWTMCWTCWVLFFNPHFYP